MSKRIKNISDSFSLDFFIDEKNIPNQDLVKETIEYFENGEGKRVFKPIDLLNLLNRQYNFLVDNLNDADKVVSVLRSLPLNKLEKHILFGLIIKWFGGYPVNNANPYFDKILKVLESDFLNYPEDTAEKEFCRENKEHIQQLKKIEIAINTAWKNNLNAQDLFSAMSKTPNTQFKDFESLYSEIVNENYFGEILTKQDYITNKCLHEFGFTCWLQENRKLQYNDQKHYLELLTKDNFLEYLRFDYSENQRLKFIANTNIEGYELYQQNYNSLKNRFRVKRLATKKDSETFPKIKKGDVIEYEPEYKNTLEAYSLLTGYYAKLYFELEKYNFIQTYQAWNEHTVKAELLEMEKFINESKNVNLTNACKAYGSYSKDNDYFIYKRFEAGFYENLEFNRYPLITTIGNPEAKIYGHYFLFYNFLREKLTEFKNPLLIDIKNVAKVMEMKFIDEFDLRNRVEEELKNISNLEEKVAFLKREKEAYLHNLSFDTLASSGVVKAKIQTEMELFFDRWITTKIAELQGTQQLNNDSHVEPQNNYQRSTIEDWLYQFKDKMVEKDYLNLVSALETYFTKGYLISLTKPVTVMGKVNKKLFGWNLNQIYRALKTGSLDINYLLFAKENISLFKDVPISTTNYKKSTLYKYFTTKTQ